MTSTTASSSTALLFGATGATGSHVLKELLASNQFTRVVEAGRRVTPPELLEGIVGKEKLVQKVVDFEKIDQAGLKDVKADVVVITLGTTIAIAGSQEKFTLIDRQYPVKAAEAAKTSSGSQRLIYVSSTTASPNSWIFYAKSKGLTEQDLAALGYSDLIVFRPGLLKDAARPDTRIKESMYGMITGVLSNFSSNLEISVKLLGKSITRAAESGSAKLPTVGEKTLVSPAGLPPYHVIFNKGALGLSALTASS